MLFRALSKLKTDVGQNAHYRDHVHDRPMSSGEWSLGQCCQIGPDFPPNLATLAAARYSQGWEISSNLATLSPGKSSGNRTALLGNAVLTGRGKAGGEEKRLVIVAYNNLTILIIYCISVISRILYFIQSYQLASLRVTSSRHEFGSTRIKQ